MSSVVTTKQYTTTRTEAVPIERNSWVRAAILAILIALTYYKILASLVLQWLQDPNYSHGFFVPLFCGWILWKERKSLAEVPVEESWAGFVVILGALVILITGTLGAENFLSRTSFLFLLAGLIIYFRGRKLFRAVLFPWGVLFLMIPLPAIIFNEITLPLQFQASGLASNMLSLVGIPVLREGNIIYLPSITLDVADACSGLRSLVSLITLTVIYGYLFEAEKWRRALLVLSALPIAVMANGLRIMGSGVAGQYWSPDKAEGFFHLFSGLLVFFVSFVLLLVVHGIVSSFGRLYRMRHA